MKMRAFTTILFLFLSHLSFAQISLVQPLEKELTENKLFGNHEHYFICGKSIKLDSVKPSVGRVYEVTDSSFKYKISHSISKGKMKFNLFYRNGSQRSAEELEFEFVPKTRFTFKVTNLAGKKPSPSELKANSVKFNFFLDNQPVTCELLCYELVNVCRRCDMPSPITCCDGIIKSDGRSCLSTIDARNGDKIYFESPVIKYQGIEIKTEAIYCLKY